MISPHSPNLLTVLTLDSTIHYKRAAIEHGGEDVNVMVGDLTDGLYVDDDAPGISAGDRERVFEAGVSSAPERTGFEQRNVQQITNANGWMIHPTEGSVGDPCVDITDMERNERSCRGSLPNIDEAGRRGDEADAAQDVLSLSPSLRYEPLRRIPRPLRRDRTL